MSEYQPTSIPIRGSDAEALRCEEVLSLIASGATLDPDLVDWATRTAVRLARNSDDEQEARLDRIFVSALSSSDLRIAPRHKAFLANAALRRGLYEKALEIAQKGRDLALSKGQEAEVALCSSLAGAAAQWLGQFTAAARWFEEAIVSARRAQDRSYEAMAQSSRALLQMLIGEPAGALEFINAAMAIYDELSDDRQVARCLLNRGIFYSKLGQPRLAELDLRDALKAFEEHNQPIYAHSAKLALGRVFMISGEPVESKALLMAVVGSTSEESDPRNLVIALEYLGDIELESGNLRAARECFQNARRIALSVGRSSDLSIETGYRLGLSLSLDGDYEEGIRLCSEALALAESQGDQFDIAAALLAKGRSLSASNPSSAVHDLRRSVEVASRIGDTYTHALASHALSKLLFASEELLEAVGFATEARRGFSKLGSSRLSAESETWFLELAAHLATRLQSNLDQSSISPRRGAPRAGEISSYGSFITSSTGLASLLSTTLRLAPRSLSMLILGETGTGKELVADAIHQSSGREGQFVPVNCGALPGELLEAELFGHARGAYTGADRERGGLIEYSHKGTLFLDEIGDMPLKAQARLLRALEHGEIRRLGENTARLVDLRILAATHRNLLEMVSAGEFRLDLYHRLTGFVITIPPLRERAADVELLIDHFLAMYAKEQDKAVDLAPEVRALLTRHAWPGNVRQLRNVIHRLVSLSEPGQIVTKLPFELEGVELPRSLPEALDAEERRRIIAALEACRWNKAKAAASLGASRTTLIAKMKRLGIEPPDHGARVR